jgi:hypothetical protein
MAVTVGAPREWYCPACRRWFQTLTEAAGHDCDKPKPIIEVDP